jgi:hypothetical protein
VFLLLDGLYVLLQPEKKRKQHGSAAEALRANRKDKGNKVPDHLKRLLMKELPPATCPWSLSGPQFPQPTAIQQRYCYPKGNAEYAGRKGGALWTMYGRDGKEDFQFRLLHVYFSAKRATNKGVTLSEEDRIKQQLQNEAANAAAMAAAGTPNRKGKRVARAARSPWQERASNRGASGKRKYQPSPGEIPEYGGQHPRRSGTPAPPVFPFATGASSLLPPSSPFQSSRDLLNRDGSIFVSPNTAASSNHDGANPFDHEMFDHLPFHPVPSFDIDENMKPGQAAPKTQCPFRGTTGGRTSLEQFRQGRSLVEQGDSFVFNEAEATEIGGNATTSSLDSWNTQLLSLVDKPTFDHSDMKQVLPCRADGTPKSSQECLKERLGHVHERIREGILAHPASKQGPLLSIVATWARSVAASPLVPTIQGEQDEDVAISTPMKKEPQSPACHLTPV